jgi:hypothetical protein
MISFPAIIEALNSAAFLVATAVALVLAFSLSSSVLMMAFEVVWATDTELSFAPTVFPVGPLDEEATEGTDDGVAVSVGVLMSGLDPIA